MTEDQFLSWNQEYTLRIKTNKFSTNLNSTAVSFLRCKAPAQNLNIRSMILRLAKKIKYYMERWFIYQYKYITVPYDIQFSLAENIYNIIYIHLAFS